MEAAVALWHPQAPLWACFSSLDRRVYVHMTEFDTARALTIHAYEKEASTRITPPPALTNRAFTRPLILGPTTNREDTHYHVASARHLWADGCKDDDARVARGLATHNF